MGQLNDIQRTSVYKYIGPTIDFDFDGPDDTILSDEVFVTDQMMDNFRKNCVQMGLMEEISIEDLERL